MTTKRTVFLLLVFLLALASACSGLGQTPPPAPMDADTMRTAIVLTENAPPPGLDSLALPLVDDGLDGLLGYRYVIEVRFSGRFTGTSRQTTGLLQAEVWADGVAPARRVVLNVEGDAFVQTPRRLEGVRVQDHDYLVDQDGRCLGEDETTARAIARLDAGSLLGGIGETAYAHRKAVLNGVESLRFDVTGDNLTLPLITLPEGAEYLLNVSGELWYAPEYAAAARYYINADVDNVRLFEGQIPVTGQVIIRYDAFDLNTAQNVSIPFGC